MREREVKVPEILTFLFEFTDAVIGGERMGT